MREIVAVAAVAFREALRQKLAVNLLVFAVALLAASITVSALTFGEQYRIIADLGLSSMEIFGTLIAVFLGAGIVAREVERRTLYPVLAKPVSRSRYLVGRYLGLVATVTLNMLVMELVFAAVLATYTGSLRFLADTPFFAVMASMVVRFAVVSAVATFFSTFSTVTLAAIFTLSLVVAGHLSLDLVRYWSLQGSLQSGLARAAFIVVPNFEVLNLKEAMVYRDPIPASFALTGLAYGLCYATALVAFSTVIFSRRDLR